MISINVSFRRVLIVQALSDVTEGNRWPCRGRPSEEPRSDQHAPFCRGASERWDIMSRNALYFLIGLLAVALVVSGYLYYQESRSGIDIQIGEDGIKIEGN